MNTKLQDKKIWCEEKLKSNRIQYLEIQKTLETLKDEACILHQMLGETIAKLEKEQK